MGYRLKPGVSFCRLGGQLLFLDIHADRYFRLHDQAEAALDRLCVGRDLDPAAQQQIDMLVETGLLRPTADDRIPHPTRHSPPDKAIDADARLDIIAMLRLAAAQIRAAAAIRWSGLAATLAKLEARRPCEAARGLDGVRLAGAARRLRKLRWNTLPCLPRSIGLAWLAFPANSSARLVIGTRLAPFEAHSWLEIGEAVVDERPAHIARLTTILVV